MKPLKNQFILPFALLIALSTARSQAQTPAPATNTPFSFQLTDKTTATAVLLPTTDGQAYIVYATSTGKLAFYLLTPLSPTPPPDPKPTPPPTPTKLTIAIVEDPAKTTVEQRQTLSDPTWRDDAAKYHNFKGIIPSNLIEKETGKPPADLSPFLDRAKKANVLPWLMLADPAGRIIFEGPLPSTPALKALIAKYTCPR
jgi:hypothetical protein